jgi:3-hydroxyisobutyrate dehydrogenase-like beta-hydroxyacid dehydrogenase
MAGIENVALIGFGEAGGILGTALAANGVQVAMYDRLLDDPHHAQAMRDKAQKAGVRAAPELAQALAGAQLIVSAVTAASDVEVAEAASRCIARGQTYLDINSVSPHTKQHGQQCIEAAGGHYVEAAVMAPVPPYGLKVPMLLGGSTAEALAPQLQALGFNARAVSPKVGVASAAKMCRSVMIKGIEALSVECLSAARRYGAEEIVLASLKETFGKMQNDTDVPGYLISRVAEHGRRRAEEMREVAQTLRDARLEPLMSEACAQLQDGVVDAMQARGIRYEEVVPFVWRDFLDQLAR